MKLINLIKNKIKAAFFSVEEKPGIPICIFTHHKGGTILFRKIFKEICSEWSWSFIAVKGKNKEIPSGYDVVLFSHSGLDFSNNNKDFIGVHIIRHPKDIIVSGYLYHKRCQEKWCIHKPSSISPILFPNVPYSQEHRDENWKINYVQSLNHISYQNNLLELSLKDGLIFEMDHYAKWTIEDMAKWNYENSNILELKFEDVMKDFEKVFIKIFNHLQFSATQTRKAISIANKHNMNQFSDRKITENQHISSKNTNRWKEYFDEDLEKEFSIRFGDVGKYFTQNY